MSPDGGLKNSLPPKKNACPLKRDHCKRAFLFPRINFQQIWQVSCPFFQALLDIQINGPIEPIWKLVPTRLRNEKERICFMFFQSILVLAFLRGSTFQKKGAFSAVNFFDGTPPSRQVDGARTQGTSFFFGGVNLFTRQVGKWKVGRCDESRVQTKWYCWWFRNPAHHLGCRKPF